MPGTPKDAWSEVGERFSSWGRLLADRYRERGGETPAEAAQDEETRRKLDAAAREVTEQLNRAFTALGDTLRDAEAKDKLKEAVRSLGDAVSVTVSETTDELRKRFRSGAEAAGDGESSPGQDEPKSP
jgi:CRISPR/Cas system-associated protein Cas10 (large subunit of type III CRISPR-Cas system)